MLRGRFLQWNLVVKRMLYLIAFGFLLICSLPAQNTFHVSNDTAICKGRSAQLHVSGGSSYTWTPSNTLNNQHSANPIATPTHTTAYVVTSTVQTANLVVNGDFSAGDTGFTSGYIYQPAPNTIGTQRYWVGSDPSTFSGGMSSCPDHTGNSGNMLVADGAENPNIPVWCETIAVYPNTTYNLKGYIQTLNQYNLPKARWLVNDSAIGNIASTYITCVWSQFSATWNSGNDTVATFCVLDPDISVNGNDFAIDDISITATLAVTDTVIVTVVAPPIVNLGSDTVICVNNTIELNAVMPNSFYLWNNGDSTPSIMVTTPGAYTVKVIDSIGCSAKDTIVIGFDSIHLSTSVVNTNCGDNNGSASANILGGHSQYFYIWSNDDTTITISNLIAGTYNVTATDLIGCSASASATVNPSGVSSLTIVSDKPAICPTDSAHICAPSGYVSYEWNTGDTSSCIYTQAASNYYVTATDVHNCKAISNHLPLDVHQLPAVSVSVEGDTLVSYSAATYQWYFNNNIIANATSNIWVATQQGSYSVLVSDTSGCTAMSSVVYISTGINNLPGNNLITVYPNPIERGTLTLQAEENMVGSIVEIIDFEGRIAYKSEIINQKSEIDFFAAPGMYLMRIISKNASYCFKLIRL